MSSESVSQGLSVQQFAIPNFARFSRRKWHLKSILLCKGHATVAVFVFTVEKMFYMPRLPKNDVNRFGFL